MPPLVARLRALYEQSDIPVRELALLAGVSERMIYKYRRKYRWLRREDRRAVLRGERAAALSEPALAEIRAAATLRVERAAALREARSRERMLGELTGALVGLMTLWVEREAGSAPGPADPAQVRFARLAGRIGHAIIDLIEQVVPDGGSDPGPRQRQADGPGMAGTIPEGPPAWTTASG